MNMDVTLIGDERMILEFLSLGLYMTSGKTDYEDHARLAENAISRAKLATGNVTIRIGYAPAVVAGRASKKGKS